MRINELIAAKTTRNMAKSHFDPKVDLEKLYPTVQGYLRPSEHVRRFLEKLSELGFSYSTIGYGIKALVFQRPSDDYVIKIFRQDKAYLDYVYLCRRHTDNPFFPKFRGKPIEIAKNTYAVRIERLAPITRTNDLIQELKQCRAIKHALKSELIVNKYPKLLEAFQLMAATFGTGGILDLHIQNVMMRGDQLVLTDPVI